MAPSRPTTTTIIFFIATTPTSRFPESRAEDSLGFTKVPPSKAPVNLSPGRQTVPLGANVCTLNVELDRLCCRLGASSHLEFAVDVPQMGFDGALAQAQAVGDRLVAHALHHHPEDLGLPFGKRLGQGPPRSFEAGAEPHDHSAGQRVIELEVAGVGVLD